MSKCSSGLNKAGEKKFQRYSIGNSEIIPLPQRTPFPIWANCKEEAETVVFLIVILGTMWYASHSESRGRRTSYQLWLWLASAMGPIPERKGQEMAVIKGELAECFWLRSKIPTEQRRPSSLRILSLIVFPHFWSSYHRWKSEKPIMIGVKPSTSHSALQSVLNIHHSFVAHISLK